ncbi:MAG: YtxH domain-containing protein [Lentimicrobiaceae bacterium]|jgi:gas vesicle protein
MGTKTLLIGVLAGAAAGAVLGILYAPDKGSNTRRRFSRKSYAYSDELEQKFNDLIDNITEQFQTVVEEVNLMADAERLKTEKVKTATAK